MLLLFETNIVTIIAYWIFLLHSWRNFWRNGLNAQISWAFSIMSSITSLSINSFSKDRFMADCKISSTRLLNCRSSSIKRQRMWLRQLRSTKKIKTNSRFSIFIKNLVSVEARKRKMFELEWPQEKLSKQLEWYQKSQKFELFQPQNKPLFDRRKAYNINIVENTFFIYF